MVGHTSESNDTRYPTTLMSRSTMVRAQMLSELEEVIAYKQFADQPDRQQTLRKTWSKRWRF